MLCQIFLSLIRLLFYFVISNLTYTHKSYFIYLFLFACLLRVSFIEQIVTIKYRFAWNWFIHFRWALLNSFHVKYKAHWTLAHDSMYFYWIAMTIVSIFFGMYELHCSLSSQNETIDFFLHSCTFNWNRKIFPRMDHFSIEMQLIRRNMALYSEFIIL